MTTPRSRSSTALSFANAALDWIYPPCCSLCRTLGPSPICTVCQGEMEPAEPPRVLFPPNEPLAFRASVYRYGGRAGQAVRRLKFERSTALARPMGADLALAIERLGLGEFDAVVPVPIHWSRKFYRGFNQSELMVRGMQDVRTDLIWRVRATRPQVGLSIEERMRNLRGAFRASFEAAGMTVLLVDDVATSGGTAIECARALREAGAREVGALTYAGG